MTTPIDQADPHGAVPAPVQNPFAIPSTKLVGTLMLPLETVEKTGSLFPVMAIMLRSAGMDIVALGQGEERQVELRAEKLHIPFTAVHGSNFTGKLFHVWKHGKMMALLKAGPVICADIDFAHWAGPDCTDVPGLTIFNVGALLQQGTAPQKSVIT